VVEGARLESVFRGNSNEGSNPSLSATLYSLVSNKGSLGAALGFTGVHARVSAPP
jgi:hypothetical protein